MRKYSFLNRFLAIFLIFEIVFGNSVTLADNVENTEVEQEIVTLPITDKSVDRVYDGEKGMYRYSLSDTTSFSSSVPNGIITNDEVYIDISDKVDYEFTKDDEKFSYSRGEPIEEDGVYRLLITTSNQSEFNIDFSEYDFSFDSTETEFVEDEETEIIEEKPEDTEEVLNSLSHGAIFEFKFRIINEACNNINIFNLPYDYAYNSISFEEENVSDVKKMSSFYLANDGKYVFDIYDKSNPNKKFSTEIIVKRDLPMLKLEGVVNGLSTYNSVSVSPYEDDVTYTATCNGNAISPYNGAFSEAGLYVITAKDEAGNTNEYTFRILYTMNVSGGTVIAIFVFMVVAIIGYVMYLKKHMRVC